MPTRHEECTACLQAEVQDSKAPDSVECKASVLKQGSSAEAQAYQQPREAAQHISGAVSAGPESLPAPEASAASIEAAARSRSSALSPQASLHVHAGLPHEQQERDLPSMPAPAAQPIESAAQDQGPWQEVRSSRRKPVSQQAPPTPGARMAPKQSGGAPDQDKSASAPQQPWKPHLADQSGGSAQLYSPDMLHTELRFASALHEQVSQHAWM